jgi:hypothetical protein
MIRLWLPARPLWLWLLARNLCSGFSVVYSDGMSRRLQLAGTLEASTFLLRFRSRARWSVQYCENSSTSRSDIFCSRKKSKEHDYISELMLTNCPKSVRSFCEDIADVRHLSTFLPLRWG